MRLLFWLRMVAIGSQVVAVAVAYFVLDGPLPLREIGLAIGALALWNALNYGPVHRQRDVQDAEVASAPRRRHRRLHGRRVLHRRPHESVRLAVSRADLARCDVAADALRLAHGGAVRRGLFALVVAQRAVAARACPFRQRVRSAPRRHVDQLRDRRRAHRLVRRPHGVARAAARSRARRHARDRAARSTAHRARHARRRHGARDQYAAVDADDSRERARRDDDRRGSRSSNCARCSTKSASSTSGSTGSRAA